MSEHEEFITWLVALGVERKAAEMSLATHDEQVRAAAWERCVQIVDYESDCYSLTSGAVGPLLRAAHMIREDTPAEQKEHPEDGHERGETFATAPEWCWVCHPENDPSAEQKESN